MPTRTHSQKIEGRPRHRQFALRLAIAVVLALLPLRVPAQPAAKPATLQDALLQIEALKKQVSDLEKFVKEQVQQRPATPAATAATTQPSTTSTATPDKAAESGFVKWNEIVAGKSRFKLYGFLRADTIFDDSRPGGNAANSSLVPAFILSENGFGGAANLAPAPNSRNFVLHPRLTRLGLDFTGPELEALGKPKVGGKLEIDFYNLVAGGAESREFPRLRHGYLTLKWEQAALLAGQTSDLISQNFPVVNPDFVMWGAGNLGDRRPQLRLEYTPKVGPGNVLFQGAVGWTGVDDNRDLDANGIRDGEAAGSPTLQARLGYRFPIWEKQNAEVAFWAHTAREKISAPAAGTFLNGRRNFTSDGFGMDLSVPLYKDLVSLKGELWTGKNLDDVRGGILQGINATTGQEIHAQGGWTELAVRPAKWYSLHGGYLFDNPRFSDLPATAPDLNSIWYLAGRLYFDPIEIGLDYLNWTTYFKDTVTGGTGGRGKGQDNRFQAYISYKF